METLLKDIRYGIRGLLKRPGFTVIAHNTPAPANYVDWKTQNQSFVDMAASHEDSFNLTGDGEPERVSAYTVNANFFPLLGVQPLLGRGFTAEEDRSGGSKAVVLSYGLWQSRYGGDRNILNREILLNGEKHAVVGVMPASFQFFEKDVRVWTPIALTQEAWANRGGHYLTVVARLKPGVSVPQAQA